MSLWKNKKGNQSCAKGASQKAEGEISLYQHYDCPRTLPGQSSSYSSQTLCAVWAQSIAVAFLSVPYGAQPSNSKAYVTVDSTVLFTFSHIYNFLLFVTKSQCYFHKHSNFMGICSFLNCKVAVRDSFSLLTGWGRRGRTVQEILTSLLFPKQWNSCTCLRKLSMC